MPWNRNDPDPIEARRRQLAEQERLLAEQMSRLTEELHSGETLPENSKPSGPPVWRMEEDSHPHRVAEPTPARKRNLARQRQRDMILFFIVLGVLLLALGIVLWVWHTHSPSLGSGG